MGFPDNPRHTGGNGGNATSTASAVASGGSSANALSQALAGVSGSLNNTSGNGLAGSANATSNATVHGPGQASAQAVVYDGATSGQALATSTTHRGAGQSVSASSSAPAGGNATAQTLSNFHGSGFGLPGISAGTTVSQVTGQPSGFLLTPNLMTAFALGSVDALGAMSIGYGGQGQSLTYQTTASFQFGYGADRHLLLGFESQSSLGAGFDSSILHVFIDSLLAYERSFTSLADAQDFFDDNTIDLGMTSSGGPGRLYDRLAQAFGRKNLFMDVDHIPAGVDFVAHLIAPVLKGEISKFNVRFVPIADIAAYSINSSAVASSAGGTARPSALAVLRLITSSYLVGACTGRSAGFSPLRMRST